MGMNSKGLMNIYNEKYSQNLRGTTGYKRLRSSLRKRLFTKLINPQKEQKILEIGFGSGELLEHIRKTDAHVYGADINDEEIKSRNDPNIKIIENDTLPFVDSYFDTIYSFEVIEHIPDIRNFLQQADRVLKPQGKFLLSFPLELFRGQAAIMDAIALSGNPLYARELHVHRLFPNKVKEVNKDTKLKLVDSKVVFIPFPSFLMIFNKNTT